MDNNIFFFLVILILFLFYCKKKLKKRKNTTQKYGLTKVKNKDNVIEYYTNPPGENCGQITKEFVNQMTEKQGLIRFHESQKEQALREDNIQSESDIYVQLINLNNEILTLHNKMKEECTAQDRCRVKYYGPHGDNNDITNTICKQNNPENINQCRPGINIGLSSTDGTQSSHWSSTLRPNGSRFIKFNKVITDSWDNILNSNNYMANNNIIGPTDFEYELNQAFYYVIKYDKIDNFFTTMFGGPESVNYHLLFKNNPTYKVISPIRYLDQDRGSFENGTLDNEDDISRCKNILKILFMREELGEIYTENEINNINDNYEEDEDSTIPSYIVGKYNEINTRVDALSPSETLFTLKNKHANILVESYKNIFDYCDFEKPESNQETPNSPKEVQKQINSNTYPAYYDRNGNLYTDATKRSCEGANGEFIELLKNENDLSQKDYFCISGSEFRNPKNHYYQSYYDTQNDNKLINPSDFEDINVFKHKIRPSEIDNGNIEKRKTGIQSGNRVFSLAFDDLCRQCDHKFDGHGVLGSIFDPKTQNYKITSCVNSNDTTNEHNLLIDPEIATQEFYTIDNNENFVKFTKVELEIENQEDMLSDEEYMELLRCDPACTPAPTP